jgi:hypothetical protein
MAALTRVGDDDMGSDMEALAFFLRTDVNARREKIAIVQSTNSCANETTMT